MRLQRYLCVQHDPGRWNCKPSARLSVKLPSLDPNEIAIKLDIEIPDALFQKPALQASITVPEDAVTPPVLDAEVTETIREELQKRLGVDLTIAVVQPTQGD